MHTMQMAYVSIVGAAGYTGQETLDRVLGHPELELYAVGSDSLAGSDATALDPRLNRNGGKRVPRLITNDAALACEADVTFLCLSHEEAASIELPSRGVVVDLSGAHRLADAAQYDAWYGFTHPRPADLGSWSYGLPELSRPEGRAIANPGCYATAVLLALAPLAGDVDPGSVVVDAMSGMTGAGRTPKASTHAGLRSRERLAVQGRRAPARRRDRPAARVPGLVHAAPPARPARAARDVQRPLDGRRPPRPPRGALRVEPGRHRPPRGRRPRARARPAHRRGRDRRLRRPAHRPHDRDLRARQPRQGRRRPGGAERQRAVRLRRDGGAPALGSPGLMSVTAAEGFAAAGVSAGIRPSGKPDVALVRSLVPAVGCAMWTRNRVQAAPVVVSRRHLELARAAGGRRQRRRRERGHRAAPGEEDAAATAAHTARLLGLAPEEVIVLSTGRHRTSAADGEAVERRRRGRRHPLPRRRPGGVPGDPHDGRRAEDRRGGGDGFVVGGMAKGAGMIHPALATMLAVVTTDYPLEPGEADALPPAGRRGDVQPHLGRRRLLDERRGRPARERAVGRRRATRRPTRGSPPRSARSAPTSRARSSPTARARPSSSRSASRARSTAEDAQAIARRVATSPLVKTAAFGHDPNWGRVLAAAGSAPSNGGFAHLDPDLPDRLVRRHRRLRARRADRAACPSSAGAACTIDLDLGLGAGEAAYLASDLSYDYVRLNAEYTT